MKPRLSVIIDNYNYARFLRQAIDSALDQTYPDVDVVVVDDGSTDQSRDIIRSYGDRIRPILKGNGGQASAFNAGFAAAQGEIIAFLDADDYLAPHAAAKIVAAWGGDVDILHHRLRTVDASGREEGWNPPEDEKLDTGNVVPLLLRDGFYGVPPTSGLAYSRRLLEKILPMPEPEFRICADTYLFMVAPFHAPVTVLGEKLAYYRVHGANAFGMAGKRRAWTQRRLDTTRKFFRVRLRLIQDLSFERGLAPPDISRWKSSETYFEDLLSLRARRGRSFCRGGPALIRAIARNLRAEHVSLSRFLRRTLLATLVWLAPDFILRSLYPKLFPSRHP